MGFKTALNHKTSYKYDRAIRLGPQIIRLRPAAHSRTKVLSYSLRISPKNHFLNWIQDPYGNFLARLVFPDPVTHFEVEVDLVADLTVYNPFDFFLEPQAETYPFELPPALREDLAPYLRDTASSASAGTALPASVPLGERFAAYAATVSKTPVRTIDFLVALNQKVQGDIGYRIRMEPNIQSPDDTLRLKSGSCRDSALLLVELLRSCGFAARFVSGYLIQMVPDRKPLVGPPGPQEDFTDLHAWAEAYVPGAGWIGLDPTSGLLAGEGHIPLAATPKPGSASPVEGMLEPAEVEFAHHMSVRRLEDEPRPFKPFPHGGAEKLDELGFAVDKRLEALGVTLTIGAEPTFVSDTDRQGAEWNGEAMGPSKKGLSLSLMHRLRARWAPGALIHTAQGKWYPGESLPRWALSCFWREDGKPLWKNPGLLADEQIVYGYDLKDAQRFMETLVDGLGVDRKYIHPAYEDPMHFMLKERNLPANVTPGDSKLADPEERARIERVFSNGLDKPIGFVLPIQKGSWKSGPWPMRSGRLILIPGDSPMGLRLPLESLPWATEGDKSGWFPNDAMFPVDGAFPDFGKGAGAGGAVAAGGVTRPWDPAAQPGAARSKSVASGRLGGPEKTAASRAGDESSAAAVNPVASRHAESLNPAQKIQEQPIPEEFPPLVPGESAAWVVRTAMCVQIRDGRLYVFFPPVRAAEDWFALAAEVEIAAERCGLAVVLEGYAPPYDPRIKQFQITPDPGVIEVNLPPGANWREWRTLLDSLYEEAALIGLSTEKYLIGGQVVGTGGGCHIILGGSQPSESAFLKRPDLLRSWIAYANRHPVLSYAFAGLFIGSTSQAPRSDESNVENLHAIELAFAELDRQKAVPPWLSDRLFRNLLTDGTGNTHRTEICIDKMFSPDHASGRRGLVEFRSFEMAPHVDLALTQSLLLRALTAHFLEEPYREPLIRWGTALRDKWMLPYFLWQDMNEVLAGLDMVGLHFPREPFAAHWDFRFPKIGSFVYDDVEIELSTALEPWPVLGEEPGSGGTVRYVDSSVERIQVLARNWDPSRYMLACRGYRVPLLSVPASPAPAGGSGIAVAGIRFKAWNLPSGLHPTIPADGTLVIDLIDLWNHRVVAGCTFHVAHPAGRNYEHPPVNAFEAEARRAARIRPEGHTPGELKKLPLLVESPEFPHTLDVRRYAPV